VWLFLLIAAALAGLWRLPDLSEAHSGQSAWSGTPQFSVRNAWSHAETLATKYPRRWSGSADRRAAADWIATTLQAWGLEVHRSRFDVPLGEDRPTTLENVWGISHGTERGGEIIVVLGNYDMAPTSYQAASDTAGHVGTILELARVLHATPHRRTFLFLFPDGEEWGMLGARHFIRTFPDRQGIVAAISIEDLDASEIAALGVDGVGQFRGFAPMWLRELAADAARHEDLATAEVTPFFEWLQRSVLVSFTDQGPFVAAGVPAIDLGGRTADRATQNRIYHLEGDTMDKLRPRSMEIYGRTQERILRALDTMLRRHVSRRRISVPRLAGSSDRRDSWPSRLPYSFLCWCPCSVARGREASLGWCSRSRGVLDQFWSFLSQASAFSRPSPAGLMLDFALYPPPPRHALLTDVNWTAVAVPLIAVGGLAWLAWRIMRSTHKAAGAGDARSAVTILRGWLLSLAVVALVDNAFGAVTFLICPALLWVWIEPSRSWFRKAANAVPPGLR
jgi:hypothetical protein